MKKTIKYIEDTLKTLEIKQQSEMVSVRLAASIQIEAYEEILAYLKSEQEKTDSQSDNDGIANWPLKEVRGEDVGQVIPEKVIVEITGHDSWGGPETWEKGFFSKVSAQEYVDEINGKNTEDTVPDYYRTARIKE